MRSNEEKSKDVSGDSNFDMSSGNVMRVWRMFFLVVVFILFLLVLWQAIPVLLMVFAGALFAIALRFLAYFVSRFTRLPMLWSLSVVIAVIFGGSAVGLFLAAPAIAEQFQELGSNLKESLEDLEETLRGTEAGSAIMDWIDDGVDEEDMTGIWEQVATVFTMTFEAIAAFFLTLIVGLFLAYNPHLYLRGFLRLIPISRRERAHDVLKQIGDTLRWWMVGQLISMLVLAVTTWLMLMILGVPLAFLLGVMTGLLTFIPYLGPILALIPILLVALSDGAGLMFLVLVLYMVIQNAEANVLMPIIFKKTVHLPPVLTLIAQILLGAIFGFVGIILATPLMATSITLIRTVYVEDVLGDTLDEPLKPEGKTPAPPAES